MYIHITIYLNYEDFSEANVKNVAVNYGFLIGRNNIVQYVI